MGWGRDARSPAPMKNSGSSGASCGFFDRAGTFFLLCDEDFAEAMEVVGRYAQGGVALESADSFVGALVEAVVLELGVVRKRGSGADLLRDPEVREAYLSF